MNEVEKITKQITQYRNKIAKLAQHRREICTHENIKYECWQPDEYAFPRVYADSFQCTDCGLYASSDNQDDTYKMLDKKYYDKKYNRT